MARTPNRSSWNGVVERLSAAGHRSVAQRAGSRRTVEIAGASHVVGISQPEETARIILEAAAAQAVSAT